MVETAKRQAANLPENAAIICDVRSLTYAELDAESDLTASALVAEGVRKGSRIAYLGKDSEIYYDILFGCAKSGAVLVPINWRLTCAEISHILADSTAELIFIEQEFMPAVEDISDALPALNSTVVLDGPETGFKDWKRRNSNVPVIVVAHTDDPVVQIYTSGTTGPPKGVVLAHRTFFAVRDMLARNNLDWIDWQADDRNLISVPSFHIGGLWWAVQGLIAGVTNIILRSLNSGAVLEAIRQQGVTTACMVPAMMHMLTAEPSASSADFATLRKLVYGGSPISEALLTRCRAMMNCEFAQIYGLTETGNTAVCLPPHAHTRGGHLLRAAGLPYPGVEVSVLDKQGNELEAGQIGEIRIKSPACMREYWGQPTATAETLRDGWVRTGDAGYLDADGYIYICDRIKDVVIVAGENIYPAEIERLLEQLPTVVEAAVIGIPDERWGERLHAVVVRRNEAVTYRQLAQALRKSLANFKIPTSWEFADSIPRNPSGKVLRRRLRQSHCNGRAPLM
ncbi:long-chain-fatty-acid--CoA ligase [Nocardia sp. 2YAB30]|uniref:long-chain-fatty-acid--CoA ligase n=1 Tax=unclassified Nocardia TaxID=2637762 RepID=UPI003F980FFF